MTLALEKIGMRVGAAMHLEDIDLSLPASSVTVLLGPTLAGKTSLLRAGLVPALEEALGEPAEKKPRKTTESEDDFGDCLLLDDEMAAAQVHVLDDDAIDKLAAFDRLVAGRLQRSDAEVVVVSHGRRLRAAPAPR